MGEAGENEEHNRLRMVFHAWSILKFNFRINFLHYNISKPTLHDSYQTQILVSEIKSKSPDAYFVVRALESGADPNAIVGKHLERALHRAARKGNSKIVEYLIQAGADINALNGRHQTPLIVATDSKRTDSAYIKVVRFLAQHRDAKIEIADVGGNTALLNGIFSSNVWITRELLLAGAEVTRVTRGAYDVALFILAEHIHLDVSRLPDRLIHPWNYSLWDQLLSPRGAYSLRWLTMLQGFSNSDIELVFKMVQHRLLELEAAGVDTSVSTYHHKKKPEEKSEEPEESDEERLRREELELREIQRQERDRRRREDKRLRREAAEKERWDGVIAGIEKSVNRQYGYKPSVATEAEQIWTADTSSATDGPLSESSRFSSIEATRRVAGKGIGNTRSERGSVALSLRSREEISRRDEANSDEYSEGKRWKVAEKTKSSVYSLNPLPGIGEATVSASSPQAPASQKFGKVVAVSRLKKS